MQLIRYARAWNITLLLSWWQLLVVPSFDRKVVKETMKGRSTSKTYKVLNRHKKQLKDLLVTIQAKKCGGRGGGARLVFIALIEQLHKNKAVGFRGSFPRSFPKRWYKKIQTIVKFLYLRVSFFVFSLYNYERNVKGFQRPLHYCRAIKKFLKAFQLLCLSLMIAWKTSPLKTFQQFFQKSLKRRRCKIKNSFPFTILWC